MINNYLPEAILAAKNTAVNKTDKKPCPWGAYSPSWKQVRGKINKISKQIIQYGKSAKDYREKIKQGKADGKQWKEGRWDVI